MYKILVPVDFSEKSNYAVKMAAKIGENISVRRLQIVTTENGVLGAYKHGERIAVLTVLSGTDGELATDIAMHIAASKPGCVSETQL